MSRLQQIKDQIAQDHGYNDWADMYASLVKRDFITVMVGRLERAHTTYTTEMIQHNLDRAADRSLVEVDGDHGKTLHGSFNSEAPKWVARVNKLSITNTEIELI